MDALQAATRLHERTLAHGEALRGLDAVLAKLAEPIKTEGDVSEQGKPSAGAPDLWGIEWDGELSTHTFTEERVAKDYAAWLSEIRDGSVQVVPLYRKPAGLAELVAVVREIEWGILGRGCLICDGVREGGPWPLAGREGWGHAEDCELAAALSRVTESEGR